MMAKNYCNAVAGQSSTNFKDEKRNSWPELGSKGSFGSSRTSTTPSNRPTQVQENLQFPKLGEKPLETKCQTTKEEHQEETAKPCLYNKPQQQNKFAERKLKMRLCRKSNLKKQKIDVDIIQAIQASLCLEKLKKNKDLKKKPVRNVQRGNMLDSDQPTLHKGKIRQRRKKPSLMKKTFLLSRKLHREKIPYTSDIMRFKNELSQMKSNGTWDLNIDKFADSFEKIKIAEPEKQPEQILDILKITSAIVHSKKFRGYCKNLVTAELKKDVSELIISLRKFHDKLYLRDEIKAHAKRRYVCGFKETKKFLLCNKIKFLIIATNLEIVEGLPTFQILDEILNIASSKDIPIIYGATAEEIGYWTLKKRRISALGVLDYDGANESFIIYFEINTKKHSCLNSKFQFQETYRRLMVNWEKAKHDYSTMVNVIKKYLTSNCTTNSDKLDINCLEKEIRENVISKLLTQPENVINVEQEPEEKL